MASGSERREEALDAAKAAPGGVRGWLREVLGTLLPAVLIVVMVNLFLAQPRTVHGQSMEPNLEENQRVILDLVTYRFRAPIRGEIVVINVPYQNTDPLIKRVIGLPGDIVEVRGGAVYVNNQKLDETYLADSYTAGFVSPLLIPDDCIFVLGDNRACSNDSRYFGPVPLSAVLGRAWFRYWPFSTAGFFHQP